MGGCLSHYSQRRAGARRRAFLAALLVAGALAAPAPVFADAFFTYGLSPRAMGMGNAFIATADDWASSYYNPAGGGFQHRPVLGFGYAANFQNLRPIGVDDLVMDESRAMLFGVNLPIPLDAEFLRDRFTFGVAGYMPEGRILQMMVNEPSDPNLILLQNAHRTNAMYPSLAIRLTDGLAIGGGVQTFFDTIGRLRASLDAAGNIRTEVGEELFVTYAPHAGVLFKPGEHWEAMSGWSFGFVYRDESFTRYNLPVAAVLDQIPFIILFKAVSLYTPTQYALGVAKQLGPCRVELDGSYNQWSQMPDPNLIIKVQADIPIVPIHFADGVERPPGFHDTITARAGVEVETWRHRDFGLFARTGYMFDPSPVPAQHGYTNQLDADRHAGAVSAGVNWTGVGDARFKTPINFDAVYQLQVLPRRVAYKDDSVSPDNPGYPQVGVAGLLHWVAVSMSISFDYF